MVTSCGTVLVAALLGRSRAGLEFGEGRLLSSSITLIALSAAAGLVFGWFLCHVAHTAVRSDARHYKHEADILRSKAIRIDEQRLEAESDAARLNHELDALRQAYSAQQANAESGDTIDLVEADESSEMPARPAQPRRPGELGRLAEAFGSD